MDECIWLNLHLPVSVSGEILLLKGVQLRMEWNKSIKRVEGIALLMRMLLKTIAKVRQNGRLKGI